jgi:hypothetical protein
MVFFSYLLGVLREATEASDNSQNSKHVLYVGVYTQDKSK